MTTPRYTHDHDDCTYLGQHGRFDLYACEGGDLSYIGRWGDEGGDYKSLPAEAVRHDPDLIEAWLRHKHGGPPDAWVVALEGLRCALECHAGGPSLDAEYDERKGWCYALALRAFVERPASFPQGDTVVVTLVHGFPRLQLPGRPLYGHAWVEIETTSELPHEFTDAGWGKSFTTVTVHDPIRDNLLPQGLYYGVGRIDPQHCRRWSDPQAVLAALLEHGTIGCWAPEDELPERPVYADDE